MSEEVVKYNGGVGFFGLLGIMFIGLKLTNIINWSWWYVLLPLYGPIVALGAVATIIIAFAYLVEKL